MRGRRPAIIQLVIRNELAELPGAVMVSDFGLRWFEGVPEVAVGSMLIDQPLDRIRLARLIPSLMTKHSSGSATER